jgi:hypothetical protein
MNAMTTDAELHQWRKNRDRSRRSLAGDALFGVAGTLILIASFFFVGHRLPAWVFPVGFAGVWFQFIGDWINVRTLDRRIAAAERSQQL